MDNTQKKQTVSSAERKKKERQKKLAAMTDAERKKIQIGRKQEKKWIEKEAVEHYE